MTNRIRSFLVAAAVVALPSMASAQDQIFKVGYTDIGVIIGLGGLGETGVSFGGRFERAFKDMPDYGNGTLAFALSADVHSWDYDSFGYSYSYRIIPIGATVNYHFNLENKKIVPFLGAGLGYQMATCDFDGPNVNIDCDAAYDSGIYFIGRAGARYFLSERLAAYADVGTGGASLNLGVMFKIR
jgi:hypothetical protein